jgi:glycosyltransferase involved in cell wall biosynthesis
MKILHIIYSGLGGHGAVMFAMLDREILKNFNHEVLFLGVEEPKNEYIKKCNNLNIPYSYLHKGHSNIKFVIDCTHVIKRANATCVFTHSLAAVPSMVIASLLSLFRSKNVLRDTQAHHLKSTKDWIALCCAAIFFKKIIFLTNAAKQRASQKLSYLLSARKSEVINNGLDIGYFKSPKTHCNSDRLKPVVGMVSRLQSNKDHHTLIDGVNLLKKKFHHHHIQLDIAGDGATLQALKQYSFQLELDQNINFLGMLDEHDLRVFYEHIDIYVHATHGETMSTSIMQAQAMGLPLVASDVAGVNNIIDGTNGVLYEPNNSLDLATKLNLIICDAKLQNNLSINSRNFAEVNYSNEIMIRKYARIFRELK